MNLTVIGAASAVGLTTVLGFAELGHTVVGVDICETQVEQLAASTVPFYENGIGELLSRNGKSGNIRFSTDIKEGIRHGQIIIIAVGTPSELDGKADLSRVIEVAEALRPLPSGYRVIVIKSTVPVGSVELVRGVLEQDGREGEDFDIVSNPEFLREGQAVRDFFFPDRIVIGVSSERAITEMRKLYAPFLSEGQAPEGVEIKRPVPFVETDITSAQMAKYASNAFFATRVSFINEIAGICERVGANVQEVVKGMGYDPRIGHSYLDAGLGFGGPCLEKDVQALVHMSSTRDYEPIVLKAVLERNDHQVHQIISKVKRLVGESLNRKIIAVFGLAFKPGTSDVRDSLA